jgi:NADPH-dependent curcumin reductase CurA
MLTPDYADRYPEARAELARWLDDGRLISHQDIREGGVGAFPDVLPTLFAGENRGKLVLAVP